MYGMRKLQRRLILKNARNRRIDLRKDKNKNQGTWAGRSQIHELCELSCNTYRVVSSQISFLV